MASRNDEDRTPGAEGGKPQGGSRQEPGAKPGSSAGPGAGAQASPTRPAGAGSSRGAQASDMAHELRQMESSYFYGLEGENKPFKVALLISIVFHMVLFWFMFPTPKRGEAKQVQQKRYVIQKFRLPPPPKKEIKQKKEVKKTREKKVAVPDPTPDDPEPIRDDVVEAFDDIPIEDDFIIAEPEAPPGPLMVGGDVKPPVEVSRVEPQYTELAKAVRKEGIVILQAVIDAQGNVQQVKVLKSLGYGLDESAVEAVKKWKFKPGTLNGRPVDVIFTLTVQFKITT